MKLPAGKATKIVSSTNYSLAEITRTPRELTFSVIAVSTPNLPYLPRSIAISVMSTRISARSTVTLRVRTVALAGRWTILAAVASTTVMPGYEDRFATEWKVSLQRHGRSQVGGTPLSQLSLSLVDFGSLRYSPGSPD